MFFGDFGLKTWKSNDNMSRLHAGHKEHVPLHNIQLGLDSGQQGNYRCHAEGWCEWHDLNICFWSCYAAFGAYESNSLNTMSKHDFKSRNSGHSTSQSIIPLLADVCWFNFFDLDKVRCPHCMYNDFPVGSKWRHHFSSPTTTWCRNVWLSVQYAADTPPILT